MSGDGFPWDSPPADTNEPGLLGKLIPPLGAAEQAYNTTQSVVSSPAFLIGGALVLGALVVGIAFALAPHAKTASTTILFPEGSAALRAREMLSRMRKAP